jgi:hypothetical protein
VVENVYITHPDLSPGYVGNVATDILISEIRGQKRMPTVPVESLEKKLKKETGLPMKYTGPIIPITTTDPLEQENIRLAAEKRHQKYLRNPLPTTNTTPMKPLQRFYSDPTYLKHVKAKKEVEKQIRKLQPMNPLVNYVPLGPGADPAKAITKVKKIELGPELYQEVSRASEVMLNTPSGKRSSKILKQRQHRRHRMSNLL